MQSHAQGIERQGGALKYSLAVCLTRLFKTHFRSQSLCDHLNDRSGFTGFALKNGIRW